LHPNQGDENPQLPGPQLETNQNITTLGVTVPFSNNNIAALSSPENCKDIANIIASRDFEFLYASQEEKSRQLPMTVNLSLSDELFPLTHVRDATGGIAFSVLRYVAKTVNTALGNGENYEAAESVYDAVVKSACSLRANPNDVNGYVVQTPTYSFKPLKSIFDKNKWSATTGEPVEVVNKTNVYTASQCTTIVGKDMTTVVALLRADKIVKVDFGKTGNVITSMTHDVIEGGNLRTFISTNGPPAQRVVTANITAPVPGNTDVAVKHRILLHRTIKFNHADHNCL
jgi:hypothetical protein